MCHFDLDKTHKTTQQEFLIQFEKGREEINSSYIKKKLTQKY